MPAVVRLRQTLTSLWSHFSLSSPDTLSITRSFDSEFEQYPVPTRDSTATTLGRDPTMVKDNAVLKLILQGVVLCAISLVPVGIAALALTFTHPSTSLLVAVYAVTGAISLSGAIASSLYTYQRISRLDRRPYIVPTNAGEESQVTRVTSAMDAFNTTQRWYLPEHMTTTPTLVPRSHIFAVDRDLPPLPLPDRPSLEATYNNTSAFPSSGHLPGLPQLLRMPDPVHVKSVLPVEYLPLKTNASRVGLPPAVSIFASQPLDTSTDILYRFSASTTCIDGMRKSLEADGLHEALIDDSEDDDNDSDAGSACIYDFDKIKIRSTCSLDELLALRPLSTATTNTTILAAPRCTSCMRTHSDYRKDDHAAFIQEIAYLNASGLQSSRPKIVSAEQLYHHTSTSSVGYNIPVFPQPPGSSHLYGCVPTEDANEQVDLWLQNTLPAVASPSMRLQFHAMPPISTVMMSTCDLQLPLRYTDIGAAIVKRPSRSKNKTRSIYGERDAAANMAIESSTRNPLPAIQFYESSHPQYTMVVPAGVDVNQIVGKLQYIVSCHSSNTSQTTSVSSGEMHDLNEPMLESGGLGWRRNTMTKLRNRQKIDSSSSEGDYESLGYEKFEASHSDTSLSDLYFASAVSQPATLPLRCTFADSKHVSLCSDDVPVRSTSLSTNISLDRNTTVQLFHRPDIALDDSASNSSSAVCRSTRINLGVSDFKLVPHRVEQATVAVNNSSCSFRGSFADVNSAKLYGAIGDEESSSSSAVIEDDGNSVVIVQVT